MKKINCKISLLLVLLFLINIIPAQAAEIQIDIPSSSILTTDKPFCADVYLKKQRGLRRRERVTGGIFFGVGGTTGVIATSYTITQLGVVGTIFLGWMFIIPAAAVSGVAVAGIASLVLHDWRKTGEVAHLVSDSSLHLSFDDLVTTQHRLIMAQYEQSMRAEMKKINLIREQAHVPLLTLEEVKALYPLRPLTIKDRAKSLVDALATDFQVDISDASHFEKFRERLTEVLYSEQMCPKGKAVSLKKTKKLILSEDL